MATAAAKPINNTLANTAAIAQPSKSTSASPRDAKRVLPPVKEEAQIRESHAQPQTEGQKTPPKRTGSAPPIPKVELPVAEETKPASNATQPLAPPPKPQPHQPSNQEGPDYFSGNHNTTHFSLEPNPFEQSFGNPSTETPGRFTGLPSVASLTSPAPLGPGGTPGWQLGNSLRSGPLSPAMLPGPANTNGYFDEQFRQSFPTPNESSLRTGLTPGGGGSMFPAPSPGSQAIFNSMQSGLATPGTLDFQRTAMNAAARSKVESTNQHQPIGPTPQGINKQDYQPAQQAQMGHQDPFNSHQDREAVNSLYMLANNNPRANQFAVPNQPQGPSNISQGQHRGNASQNDVSPTAGRGPKQSIGSIDGSMAGMSDNGDYGSDGSLDQKPTSARSKGGKKGAANKSTPANGRRKADDSAGKGPPNKRVKSSSANSMDMGDMGDMGPDDSDEDMKLDMDTHPSGKKMTDEEKRKNFLERNRVAALKCRQRKKQWLANLQAKVEIFTSENDALNQANNSLRDEITNLKTLLLAHKDCTVTIQQGLGNGAIAQIIGADFNPNSNPYGMGMGQNGGQVPPGMMQMHAHSGQQGMQRR